MVRILSPILILFAIDAGFSTLMPFYMNSVGFGDGESIGLVIGLAYSLGFLLLPGLSPWIDSPKRWLLNVWSAGLMILGFILFCIMASFSYVWLLTAVIVFGMCRTVVTSALLASVAEAPGPRSLVQGLNGSAQRLGSAAGAGVVAGLITFGSLNSASFAVGIGCVLFFTAVIFTRQDANLVRDVDHGSMSFRWANYMRAILLFRGSRRIQASAILNVILMCLILSGNTFVSVSLLLEPEVDLVMTGVFVVVLVVVRDTVAVAAGPLFSLISHRLEEKQILFAITMLISTSFVLLAFLAVPIKSLFWFVVVALLQGIAIAWGIASTNILATSNEQDGNLLEDPGTRIIASNALSPPAILIVPFALGWMISLLGPTAAFFSFAIVFLAAGLLMARFISDPGRHWE